jgi:hypothetical protein
VEHVDVLIWVHLRPFASSADCFGILRKVNGVE